MSHRVLVLYASTHGHTARIAHRIGATLEASGVAARVRDVRQAAATLDLGEFDAAIVGGSIHAGHHQAELLTYVTAHRDELDAMTTAFFSVSLTAADDTDEARATTNALIDEVTTATGWLPRQTIAFAGALQFQEYNFSTRVLMRLIARRHDPHVDVHVDTDYTDWPAVERFAAAFAAELAATADAPTA